MTRLPAAGDQAWVRSLRSLQCRPIPAESKRDVEDQGVRKCRCAS
jgi:hypothetical protein